MGGSGHATAHQRVPAATAHRPAAGRTHRKQSYPSEEQTTDGGHAVGRLRVPGHSSLRSLVVSQQMIQNASTSLVDDVVAVTVPADGGWLGILRTATAGLAARLGFPGDS